MGLGHLIGKKLGISRDLTIEEKIKLLNDIRNYLEAFEALIEEHSSEAISYITNAQEKFNLIRKNTPRNERQSLKRLGQFLNQLYSGKPLPKADYESVILSAKQEIEVLLIRHGKTSLETLHQLARELEVLVRERADIQQIRDKLEMIRQHCMSLIKKYHDSREIRFSIEVLLERPIGYLQMYANSNVVDYDKAQKGLDSMKSILKELPLD